MPSLQPHSLRAHPPAEAVTMDHSAQDPQDPPAGSRVHRKHLPSHFLRATLWSGLWPGQPGPAASCLLFLLHHGHCGGEKLPEMLQAAQPRLQGHIGDTLRTLGNPLETSTGCWGPLLSPTTPQGQDASLSLASWGCGQDESRRSLIFTSSEVPVRSQALPWSLGESQRKLRPPTGPRQLVCEGPTARLPSPAPPSVLAPPFPHSREPLAALRGLVALRQRLRWFCSNTLSFPRGHLPCPAGLASSLGPRPLRHSLFRPRPLLFPKGPGAAAPP